MHVRGHKYVFVLTQHIYAQEHQLYCIIFIITLEGDYMSIKDNK
jgi:hypothetical protein